MAACTKCVVGAIKTKRSHCFSRIFFSPLLLLLFSFAALKKQPTERRRREEKNPSVYVFLTCPCLMKSVVVWTSCGHINNNGRSFVVVVVGLFALSAFMTALSAMEKF